MLEKGIDSIGIKNEKGNILGTITIENILNIFSTNTGGINEK